MKLTFNNKDWKTYKKEIRATRKEAEQRAKQRDKEIFEEQVNVVLRQVQKALDSKTESFHTSYCVTNFSGDLETKVGRTARRRAFQDGVLMRNHSINKVEIAPRGTYLYNCWFQFPVLTTFFFPIVLAWYPFNLAGRVLRFCRII